MIVERLHLTGADTTDHSDPAAYAVSIGSFDGVHRGHQYLLKTMIRSARVANLRTLVLTFDPLPFEVLHTDATLSRLTDIAERLALLESLGIDRAAVIEFTPETAQLPTPSFLESITQHYAIRQIWCGDDFAFGYKRRGDVPYLESRADDLNLSVHVVPRIDSGGQELGSRHIRQLITDGDVRGATELLGHSPTVAGPVVRGAARGRELGYPTANLNVAPYRLIPKSGIYAGFATLASERHVAAISVGYNPTFGSHPLSVEAFLLDFDRDIVGERLVIEFAHRLRDELKFESVDALVAQMDEDVRETRQFLAGASAWDIIE